MFDKPVREVVDKLTQKLSGRGFGVLSYIDVENIIKQKLGENIGDYVILDVCSPSHALRAIRIQKQVGLILPCKVVVYAEDGMTRLLLYKPTSSITVSRAFSELTTLAEEVETTLVDSIDAID